MSMKTRGKTKSEGSNQDISKDYNEGRDIENDGLGFSGLIDEKMDETGYIRNDGSYEPLYDDLRGKPKYQRGNNARRTNRRANLRTNRGRNDKYILDSIEFREVVQGFVEFIEEINKLKKRKNKKNKKNGLEIKTYKSAENNAENRKKLKYDEMYQNVQDYDIQGKNLSEANRIEKNGLYRFKDDVDVERDLYELIRRGEVKDPNLYASQLQQLQFQDQKNNLWAQEQFRDNRGYLGVDYNNLYDQNLRYLQKNNLQEYNNLLTMKQANSKISNYLFENPNLQYKLKADLMKRLQWQGLDNTPNANSAGMAGGYYMPSQFDNYSKMSLENLNMKQSNDMLNIQMLLENLKQNQPNLLSALSSNVYGVNPSFNDLTKDLAYVVQNMSNAAQRPTNTLGIEVIRDDNDTDHLGASEKKAPFKRAATHVAIAYFIYLKSVPILHFDYNNINKLDKSKMDPTYNARVLKEKKKYEMYSGNIDPAMLSKLIPGFDLGYMGTEMALYNAAEDAAQHLMKNGALKSVHESQTNPEAKEENQAMKEEDEVIEVDPKSVSEAKSEGMKQEAEKKEEPENEKKEVSSSHQPESKMVPEQAQPKQEIEETKSEKDKLELPTPGITPNDIVEEITELTNSTSDVKRGKKNRASKTQKKKEESISEKAPDDNASQKPKTAKEGNEEKEKIEEEVEEPVQLISADEFKIHIEKEGSEGFKIKSKGEGEEES